MSELLNLQFIFSENTIKLYQYIIDKGLKYTYGEAWRTPQQTKWNADHGIGVLHSLHLERLAIDLNIFTSDGILVDKSVYDDIGLFWKSLDSRHAYGGDFSQYTDMYHFSLSYQGVQ